MKSLIVGFFSLFYQANMNHENMQGTGFAFLIRKAAALNGISLEVKKVFEQTAYFHTHPYLVNFIAGVWVKEFEQNGEEDFYKKTYSSAFGAFGDSFFWHSLRPLSFVIAAIAGLYNPWLGLIVYLVFYNSFHLIFRFAGYSIGYALGKEVIVFFNRIGFNRWPMYFDVASAFFFGIMLSYLAKSCSDFDSVVLGILTVYVLTGMALAKKLDIVLGLVINMILTGFFLFITGA
ncbi:MAG: PTS system mannose/fructose/sorbose family transporter subunit IID [Deferribacterales bacterium]